MILTQRIGFASIGVLLALALLLVATTSTTSAASVPDDRSIDGPVAVTLGSAEFSQPWGEPTGPAVAWWIEPQFSEFELPQANAVYCIFHATASFANNFWRTTWEHEYDLCRKH